VATDENSGWFAGLAKVIGGPFVAALMSVSVARFVLPTFALPKFFGDGLTFSRSGT